MAETPDVLAAPPARRGVSMDALSDLLRVLRFSGGVFLDASFRAPWCMDSQVTPEECVGVAAPDAGLIGFHYVLDGRMRVRLGNAAPQACTRGDFVLLCRNDLHREALLSRSTFAERFARTLGMPPMTYLTRWRMLSAAQRLRESPASIARVAADVGYESESTFSRAFAREMGMPPGRFRQVVLEKP